MKVLLLVTSGLVALASAHRGCEFVLGNNTLNYPFLLEQVQDDYEFRSVEQKGNIFLNNGEELIATCQNQNFGCSSENCGSVRLSCKNNKPYISIHGKVIPYCSQKHKLGCKGPIIRHYPYEVEGCDKSGVLVAYINQIRTKNPSNDLVKLATFCYDKDTQKVLFADHKALHSSWLNSQWEKNIEEDEDTDRKILKGLVQPINYYDLGPKLENTFSGLQTDIWTVGHRVSSTLIGFQYKYPISRSRLNIYPVWKPLHDQNWQDLLCLLKSITRQHTIDIISGTTNGPKNVQLTPNVPTYVWSHIRIESSKVRPRKFQSAVIFGINAPKNAIKSVKSLVFCKDIFDDVAWLSELRSKRVNASRGYLFACSPEEVQKLIPEFPKVSLPSPTSTSSKPKVRKTTTGPRTSQPIWRRGPNEGGCSNERNSENHRGNHQQRHHHQHTTNQQSDEDTDFDEINVQSRHGHHKHDHHHHSQHGCHKFETETVLRTNQQPDEDIDSDDINSQSNHGNHKHGQHGNQKQDHHGNHKHGHHQHGTHKHDQHQQGSKLNSGPHKGTCQK